MKIIKGLCAAAITLLPATMAAADLLPAMTAAQDGGATVNSGTSQGYAERGRLMMNSGNYRGAADQLRLALAMNPAPTPEQEAAEFFLAQACAHIPGEDAAGMFSDFLEKYPASAYRQLAYLGLAGVLFDQKEYAAALEIYRSLDQQTLNPSDAEEKTLREAYCLLKFARYDEAASLLNGLLATPAANDARFYLAYIDYVKGDYRKALAGFEKVIQDGTEPSLRTPYYLAQLHYRLGEYSKALQEANGLLASGCPAEYLSETQRIAGECYYATGDTSRALPLLRTYIENTETPQPSALYILGINAYELGDYADAIKYLAPVVDGDNAMAQSACLTIGQSYLKRGEYDTAMLMLDRAVKKNFDPAVTESAAYNYAVASASGGKIPFGSSVVLFENFLRTYPQSPMAAEVADYIINGYISDNNYGAALRAINEIKNPSDKILAAKQQVLYIYGSRQLRAGHPDDAIKALTEARSLGRFSATTASDATLWLGEALYKKGDYKGAEKYYSMFLKETPSSGPNHSLALYDQAYAKFALKNFSGAREYFSRYIKSLNGRTPADVAALKADAYNRMADCSYYSSDFTTAGADYERAIAAAPEAADYPMFQKALMKGLLRDHAGKIADLDAMIARFPNSALIPSALLETGESHTELGDNASAIHVYTDLSRRFPNTTQGRQGALLLAIAELNSGQTDRAVTAYKHVISKYPTSEEARAAAEDLKHIYADRGDISGYTSFLASVPDAPKMNQAELVALQLEGVEKAAEAGRDNDAVRLGRQLVEEFPDTPQAVEALAIVASLDEEYGRPEAALAEYRTLAQKASTEIQVNQARLGIMRLSRDLGNDSDVLEVTNQLLQSSSLGADDRNDVLLAKAMALLNKGERAEAREVLRTLADDPQSLPGAKASYHLAQDLFDSGDLDDALKQVSRLIDSNTPHEYWLARGFILQSDIKRRQGRTFEAEELLRSLRENYPGTEADIFQSIDSRLK